MPTIILSTLNARYIHSAFGLRYLFANLGELQTQAQIMEFTINQRPADIAEQLLSYAPKIIGFGVYIWNVQAITELVGILKQVAPTVKIVLGGPEISYETEQQALYDLTDFVITGAADLAFAALCEDLLTGKRPQGLQAGKSNKIIHAPALDLKQIKRPYAFYSDADIANRIIYVEASRGCPFKCEFCLSSLDKTAYTFDLDEFLDDMDVLWQRGVRRFKFVDRTFNLKVAFSVRILEFFLQRLDAETFLHFELIPDQLPERLKNLIKQFPAGTLQFEIGIQTFNPDVQKLISRKQDNEKTALNLRFLAEHSHAHTHADLIAGLPGEDLASFGRSFDQLYALRPHEIQLGILKRLRGTPVIRHTQTWQMCYQSTAPYTILKNQLLDFNTLQRIGRFARYWDLFANNGHFRQTLPLLLLDQPFKHFMQFSDWLYQHSQQTHKMAQDRLFDYLHLGLQQLFAVNAEQALKQDFEHCGLRRIPKCLQHLGLKNKKRRHKIAAPKRQAQHL